MECEVQGEGQAECAVGPSLLPVVAPRHHLPWVALVPILAVTGMLGVVHDAPPVSPVWNT